ncbi:MAG: pentapeptide repeat-containing protein [Aulosira sp. DedQUE10]|nr:pentapeptide repeat-containing protein [Aulosira sp. DedQUE10]
MTDMTAEELLELYAAGERDFSGINLEEANLSGANLSKANFSRANLLGADLSEANLSRANLSYAKLSLCRFIGTNLEGAKVTDADIVGASLENVNLKGAIGNFGHAHGALFQNTILPNGEIIAVLNCIEYKAFVGAQQCCALLCIASKREPLYRRSRDY